MSQFGLEIFKCLLSDKTLNLYIPLVRFREFTVLITCVTVCQCVGGNLSFVRPSAASVSRLANLSDDLSASNLIQKTLENCPGRGYHDLGTRRLLAGAAQGPARARGLSRLGSHSGRLLHPTRVALRPAAPRPDDSPRDSASVAGHCTGTARPVGLGHDS